MRERKWTVIIPSCSDEKVGKCVADLFGTHPALRPEQVVIVSDGLLHLQWMYRNMKWVEGKSPFIFAEAINAGVRAADPDSDIVILGDDVRFETPGAIDSLARLSDGAAIVAPQVIGVCGQPSQRVGATTYDPTGWVAFICAYIPRAAWDAVGPLDERFVGYGYDDVDWCRRAVKYGKVKITNTAVVRHLPESSYRTNPNWVDQYEQNRTIYHTKWAAARALL